jgi:hypothetical protein
MTRAVGRRPTYDEIPPSKYHFTQLELQTLLHSKRHVTLHSRPSFGSLAA